MPSITICGVTLDKDNFHTNIKPEILKYVQSQGCDLKGYDNPDIDVKGGKLVLVPQNGKNALKTGLKAKEVLQQCGVEFPAYDGADGDEVADARGIPKRGHD
eukprot:CAMPEP_0179214106 /NCGR_PEP_ID=MMETSP0797-20121207/2102_1 /TAXON_ID=47934 /ORGANISM="Dinophysis acuminata, Strain DAEP01" /LENGTH=101 /DNA_ID=CAMNT_0020920043 /DNA_START=100 /DNA_END=405 /DNA_ORIENTATION=+